MLSYKLLFETMKKLILKNEIKPENKALVLCV